MICKQIFLNNKWDLNRYYTSGQTGPGSNGNEGILYTLHPELDPEHQMELRFVPRTLLFFWRVVLLLSREYNEFIWILLHRAFNKFGRNQIFHFFSHTKYIISIYHIQVKFEVSSNNRNYHFPLKKCVKWVELVGWFYGVSTFVGLFNAEVFFFSRNSMVSRI